MWWPSLQRQLRVEGPVERLSAKESDAYFASRSRGSRLGAWASRQGSVIAGREELEARVAELGARFGEEIPRPQWWGGDLLRPAVGEVLEGRPHRLPDPARIVRARGRWR